jgi:hypothetical protein
MGCLSSNVSAWGGILKYYHTTGGKAMGPIQKLGPRMQTWWGLACSAWIYLAGLGLPACPVTNLKLPPGADGMSTDQQPDTHS